MVSNSINLKSLSHQAVTVLLTIVITMTGFWMMIGRDFITHDRCLQMIQTNNKGIVEKLEASVEQSKELDRVIDKNTEAINSLKVQLAALNETMKYIQKEMEK
jgi:hypothetical protein